MPKYDWTTTNSCFILLLTFGISYMATVNAAINDTIVPPSKYTVDRGPDGDIIYYNHTIGCREINATDITTNKCECSDETTFYWRNLTGKPSDLKCWYRLDSAHRLTTIGASRGVTSAEFTNDQWSFSNVGDGELDFTKPSTTDDLGTYCKNINVSGNLKVMGYDGWVDENYDADLLFAVTKQYINNISSWEYMLEIDSNDKEEYRGHLVQIPLKCLKANVNATTKYKSFSLLLKFSGQRMYNKDSTTKPTTQTITTSIITTFKTVTTVTTNTIVIKKKDKTTSSSNIGLIIGVSIAAVVIIILVAFIIVMYCKRRQQQSEQQDIKMNGNGTHPQPSYTYPSAKNVSTQQANPFTRASNAFLDISQTPTQHAPPVPRSPRPSYKPSAYIEMTDQNGGQQYMPIDKNFNNTNQYGQLNDQTKQDEYLDLSGPQNTNRINNAFGKPNQNSQPEMYVELNTNPTQNVYEGLDNVRNSYADLNQWQGGYVDPNQSQGDYVDPNQLPNDYTDLNQSQGDYTDLNRNQSQGAYAGLN